MMEFQPNDSSIVKEQMRLKLICKIDNIVLWNFHFHMNAYRGYLYTGQLIASAITSSLQFQIIRRQLRFLFRLNSV